MKSITAMLGLAFIFMTIAGCSGPDTQERVMADTVSLLEEMILTLESVEDEATAVAAASKIERLKGASESLKLRMDALGVSPTEIDPEVRAKFKEEMREYGPRLLAAAAKLQRYPELLKAMKKVTAAQAAKGPGLW